MSHLQAQRWVPRTSDPTPERDRTPAVDNELCVPALPEAAAMTDVTQSLLQRWGRRSPSVQRTADPSLADSARATAVAPPPNAGGAEPEAAPANNTRDACRRTDRELAGVSEPRCVPRGTVSRPWGPALRPQERACASRGSHSPVRRTKLAAVTAETRFPQVHSQGAAH